MTSPRPIHIPSREILQEPHESEPLHSYEDPNNPLLDEEDEFHNRLSRSSRRDSSGSAGGGSTGGGGGGAGSFWRSASESSSSPAFNSAQMKKGGTPNEVAAESSQGVLANALETQQTDSASSVRFFCLFRILILGSPHGDF